MRRYLATVLLVVFPLLSLGGLFWFLSVSHRLPNEIVNKEAKALDFEDNTLQCPVCHMYLVGKNDTAQIITADRKTHFFDDVGCAILWLREQKLEPRNVVFWVFSGDTKRYIDAYGAFYSIDDKTPMLYGFRAYEQFSQGRIGFEPMRLRMLRGETMQDPKVRQNLLQGR